MEIYSRLGVIWRIFSTFQWILKTFVEYNRNGYNTHFSRMKKKTTWIYIRPTLVLFQLMHTVEKNRKYFRIRSSFHEKEEDFCKINL